MSKYTFIILYSFFSFVSYSQWITEYNTFSGYSFEKISAADSIHVWAFGKTIANPDSSILLRRTSEGWIKHYVNINGDLTSIASIDSDKVFLGTVDGRVYSVSYNQNKVVLVLDVPNQGFINDIKFSKLNPSYGYIFSDPPEGPGTPFKIFRTTNGGTNWIEYSPIFGGSYYGALGSMCVTDSEHVWIGLTCQPTGCQVPKIAFTTNGGVNWQLSQIPNGSNHIQSIKFKSNNNYGIIAPWDQTPTYLYKSTNGGISSSFLYNTQLQVPIENLSWVEGTNTWYCSTVDISVKILKSTNDGNSWAVMPLPAGTGQVQGMDIISYGKKVYGYAISIEGRILRLSDSASTIAIQNIQSEVPGNFKLYQNYPNPFNPSTQIRFDIPYEFENEIITLKIYDLLGNELEVLIEQALKPGQYIIMWAPVNFPSGVYLYKLGYKYKSLTGKMVLIK